MYTYIGVIHCFSVHLYMCAIHLCYRSTYSANSLLILLFFFVLYKCIYIYIYMSTYIYICNYIYTRYLRVRMYLHKSELKNTRKVANTNVKLCKTSR